MVGCRYTSPVLGFGLVLCSTVHFSLVLLAQGACLGKGVAAVLLSGAGAGGGHALLAALQTGRVDDVARQAEALAAGGAVLSDQCAAVDSGPLGCTA